MTRSAVAQLPFPRGPQRDPVAVAWDEARRLENEDQLQAAFLQYLALPRDEYFVEPPIQDIQWSGRDRSG